MKAILIGIVEIYLAVSFASALILGWWMHNAPEMPDEYDDLPPEER